MSANSDIKVYISTINFSTSVVSQQNHIETVLKAKKLDYSLIDIASDSTKKDEMREKIDNPTAVPPQIFNGDTYCGGYEEFQASVEEERVLSFLKLE